MHNSEKGECMRICIIGKKDVTRKTVSLNGENSIVIDDELISRLFKNNLSKINNNKTLEINIEEDINKIDIKNIQFIKKIVINSPSSRTEIMSLSVYSIPIELSNISVNKMSTHSSNLHFRFCHIGNLLNTNADVESNKLNSIVNVHNSEIKLFVLSGGLLKIDYINSSTDRFFINNQRKSINNEIATLYLDSSKINEIYVGGKIRTLKLKNAIIETLNCTKDFKIASIRKSQSRILKANNFENNTFDFHDKKIKHNRFKDKYSHLDALKKVLILKSIDKSLNKKMYNDIMYSYCLYQNRYKFYWIDRLFLGFGYKIRRLVWSTIGFIIFFGLSYFLLENHTRYNYFSLIDSIYMSGMAFTTTGFGDVAPLNTFSRFLSILESILGVTSLSLLISSYSRNNIILE